MALGSANLAQGYTPEVHGKLLVERLLYIDRQAVKLNTHEAAEVWRGQKASFSPRMTLCSMGS